MGKSLNKISKITEIKKVRLQEIAVRYFESLPQKKQLDIISRHYGGPASGGYNNT